MAAAWCKNKRIRLNLAPGLSRSKPHISLAFAPLTTLEGDTAQPAKPRVIRVIVKKWPRPRGHPKSLVTREQVAIWDLFLALISQLDPYLYNLCIEQAECSMKYARDLVIACGYGNYVSWPGHGKHPHGLPDQSA